MPVLGFVVPHLEYDTIIRQFAIKRNAVLSELGRYSIVFICNVVLSTITEAGVVVVACQYEVDRGFSRSGRFYADDFGTAHYCSGSMTLAVKKSPSME